MNDIIRRGPGGDCATTTFPMWVFSDLDFMRDHSAERLQTYMALLAHNQDDLLHLATPENLAAMLGVSDLRPTIEWLVANGLAGFNEEAGRFTFVSAKKRSVQ